MPRLHLRAVDCEDVPALSALLQDYVLKAADVAFDRRGRRLALIGNRFCWETATAARIRTAVVVSSLLSVQRRQWPQAPDAVLELLAIEASEDEGGATLTLHFAGGPAIRARAECVDLLLDDLSPPTPTPHTPAHEDS
ncbi:MAG: DUF2948 family protein [Sphingomonadaceae bacterium]